MRASRDRRTPRRRSRSRAPAHRRGAPRAAAHRRDNPPHRSARTPPLRKGRTHPQSPNRYRRRAGRAFLQGGGQRWICRRPLVLRGRLVDRDAGTTRARVGYTAVGKDGKSPRLRHPRSGRSMSRLIVLILVLLLVIGGLFFLSTNAKEVPTRTIETDVSQ